MCWGYDEQKNQNLQFSYEKPKNYLQKHKKNATVNINVILIENAKTNILEQKEDEKTHF
jgi:type IV secretory pathway component VirB8